MELTLDQALQKGIEAHKAGKAQEADRYYTAILKANPKHPDANHNMGVLAVGIGKVQEALPFFKTALEANDSIAQYWLSYIDALIKIDRIGDAKAALDQAKSKDANGDGFDQLEQRIKLAPSENSSAQDPSQEELKSLINLYTQRQYQETLTQAYKLLKKFPRSFTLYNIIGVTNHSSGKAQDAVQAYKKAISIKPDFAEAHNNLGLVLKDQGKLDEALEVYNKAIAIKPYFAEAHNNLGLVLMDQGKLHEALEVYYKTISIRPDYANPYYNLGNALKNEGQLDEAIEAYKKAVSIKPNYAEAYNNLGNALQDQGRFREAMEAYNKALSLKPDYAGAHRQLSSIKKYVKNDPQIKHVNNLLNDGELSDRARCNLNFTMFKMYEDIGKFDIAFSHLYKANQLRKKLLNYSILQDTKLFSNLKRSKALLSKNKIGVKNLSTNLVPIFVLGMPRSGTTLVEQVISSHSSVTGGGELRYAMQYGLKLATGSETVDKGSLSVFRDSYLFELSKLSNGKRLITDKLPHNFQIIPLICASLPEAKIIHVERNAAATCWSNYKQYFSTKDLGYSYDLNDVVAYYKLYRDLMKLWQSQYGNRIYNLNYESLTTDQENQTRKLIKYVDLNWEDACLLPHKNKRSVRTASQQQVRQKVYQGSSEAWRKYEPFLKGAFDSLPSA